MQSRYNAEKACDDWISQFENKLVDDTIILVYGLGDGSYVEKLLKLNDECKIIIYEHVQMFFGMYLAEKILQSY